MRHLSSKPFCNPSSYFVENIRPSGGISCRFTTPSLKFTKSPQSYLLFPDPHLLLLIQDHAPHQYFWSHPSGMLWDPASLSIPLIRIFHFSFCMTFLPSAYKHMQNSLIMKGKGKKTNMTSYPLMFQCLSFFIQTSWRRYLLSLFLTSRPFLVLFHLVSFHSWWNNQWEGFVFVFNILESDGGETALYV